MTGQVDTEKMMQHPDFNMVEDVVSDSIQGLITNLGISSVPEAYALIGEEELNDIVDSITNMGLKLLDKKQEFEELKATQLDM